MLALLLLFGVFLAEYMQWCRRQYWNMRMSIAAEMTALSVARAEAQDLNKISFNNMTINGLLVKATIPGIDASIGLTTIDRYPKIEQQAIDLQKDVKGFNAFCSGVGMVVSRLNGATMDIPPIHKPPIDSHLQPQRVYLGIIMPPPVFFSAKIVNGAYYARLWSPSFREAQPTLHATTWMVHGNGSCGIATAGVWLDARLGTFANGGFPRVNETILGGLGVQDLYPQFNARLIPTQSSFSMLCE